MIFLNKKPSHDSIRIDSYIDIESERKFTVEKMNTNGANIISLFRNAFKVLFRPIFRGVVSTLSHIYDGTFSRKY